MRTIVDWGVEKLTFLGSVKNHILYDLGSSPGFSGRSPGHFAALRAKAKDRFARAAPTPPAALAPRFSFAFARQRGEVSHNSP